MRFFQRFFAPETESLRLRLEAAERETAWWRARHSEKEKEVENLTETMRRERELAAATESDLVNNVVRLAGGVPIRNIFTGGAPAPASDSDSEAEQILQAELSERETDLLWLRAVDVATQKKGDATTQRDIEEIFDRMKKNPVYWLTD